MAQKLSIVLSTYNEEKNMEDFFENVKDIADEVVLVDGSSKDKTVEIAKRYGAKIKITDNPPIFLINRQKAIDMATGDWLFNLDADERLSPELKEEIKSIVANKTISENDLNGYWVPRKNFFLGRFLMKGGQYPDYQLRLYKRDKVHFELKDVHEQAIVNGRTDYLKNAMLHFPYFSFSHYLKKWNVYVNVLASQIKEEQSTKNIALRLFYAVMYLFVRPAHWLFTTYFRHKGFVDGWQGFVFSFFSALRFPVAYLKQIVR